MTTKAQHPTVSPTALTDSHVWFAYWIGVLLVLDKHGVTMSEVYVSGVVDQAQSLWFAERLKGSGVCSTF